MSLVSFEALNHDNDPREGLLDMMTPTYRSHCLFSVEPMKGRLVPDRCFVNDTLISRVDMSSRTPRFGDVVNMIDRLTCTSDQKKF